MTKDQVSMLTDKDVLELQQQWNPAKYEDEPNELYKDLMVAICEVRFNESIEDHRKYLEGVVGG